MKSKHTTTKISTEVEAGMEVLSGEDGSLELCFLNDKGDYHFWQVLNANEAKKLYDTIGEHLRENTIMFPER